LDEEDLVRLERHGASGIDEVERDEYVWWYRRKMDIWSNGMKVWMVIFSLFTVEGSMSQYS